MHTTERLEDRSLLTTTLTNFLTTQHVDLNLGYSGGVWTLQPRDSDASPAIVYDPGDALLYAGEPSLVSRPAGSAFDFIGVGAGEGFHRLPQSQDPALLYLGFSGYGASGSTFDRYNPLTESKGRVNGTGGRWLKVSLVSVEHTTPSGEAGDGTFSVWQSGDTAPAVFMSNYDDGVSNPDGNGLDTTDGISTDDALWIVAGGHIHYNWGFTEKGRYAVTVKLSGYVGDDGTPNNATPNVAGYQESGNFTIYFSVGSVGEVEFDASSYTVNEGDGTATVTVRRVNGSDGRITVNYATSNGTANNGSDYTGTSGTLTFNDQETSKTITFPILEDTADESDETVTLTLSNPGPFAVTDPPTVPEPYSIQQYLIENEDDPNGLIGSQGTATLTIIDNDTPPTISDITDLTIDEDTSTGALAFTVGDAETPAGDLQVTASSSDPTLVPNANIVLGGSGANRTVTVTPGATLSGVTTITITVTDATGLTSTDTFELTVTHINDVPVANSQSLATDRATPIAIVLSGSDEETPTVDFIIVTPPSHGILSGTIPNLTYTPNPTFAGLDTFTFKVNDGSQDSPLATVAIQVGNLGQVEFTSATYTVNEMAGYRDITVRRVGGNEGRLVVQYASADGTATAAGPDYTATSGYLVFEDGETSKVITIQTANQSTAIVEPNETFSLTLSVPAGYPEYTGQNILGTNSSTVITINDSPTISTIAVQTTTIGTPTAPIAFTIADSVDVADDLQIAVATSNPTLIPESGIVLDGSGANRTLTVTPVAGLSGKSTITIIVTDSNGAMAVRAVEVSVGAATTATAITLPTTLPDVVITADESFTLNYKIANASWVTQVTRSNTTLFNAPGTGSTSDLRTQPSSGGTDRTLRIRGADNSTEAGLYGLSTVTLGFTGSGAPAAQTFNVRVNPRAVADNNLVAIPGTTSTLDVLGNDATPLAGHTFTITGVSTPDNGTLQISADGKSLLYTPTDSNADSDIFTYTVTVASSDAFNGYTFTGIGYIKIGGYYVVDSAVASQHTDLAINYIDGEWVQNIHSDASIFGSVQSGTFSPTVIDSDEGVLFFDPSTKQARPASTVYDALGVPAGADIWLGPTSTNGHKPYVGFNSEETSVNLLDAWTPVGDSRATSNSKWMAVQLVGFTGPGNMALFYAGSVAFDTADGLNSASESTAGGNASDTFWGLAGSHDHPSFVFTAPGRYSFTLQTTTKVGGEFITSPPVTYYADVDTMSGNARLGENPPLANADTANAVENLGPVVIDVLGNDSSSPDPDEALSVTAVTQGSQGGTVAIAPNGTVTYTPAADFSGVDTFTYTITDEHGGMATTTVTVTVRSNEVPTAVADAYVVSTNNSVRGNVLFNDSDLDEDAITAALETGPQHGSAIIAADGSFTYTPDVSFAGSDSFTYTVTDAVGATSTATVTVTAAGFQDFQAVVGVGHSDVGIAYEEGEWNLHVHYDEIGEEYAPNEAIYYVSPAALSSRPAGAQFDFIGVGAGENYYRLPQTQNPELLYLGFGAEELEDGTFENGNLRVFLRNVNGPGQFSVWESSDEGPVVKFSTIDGITEADFLDMIEGGHSHFNWGFTAAGRYEVTLEVVGTLTGETTPTSATATYYFSVDNLGRVQFETSSDSVGEAGSKTITVQRVGGSDGPVTVDFSTGGSATDGVDYESLSNVTFADGETEKTFTIVALPDTDIEGDETISVTLVAPPDSFTEIGTPGTLDVTLTDNSIPTIGDIDNQSINEDGSVGVTVSVSDVETPAADLIVTATSSNTTLVPDGNLAFTGSGALRTLTISPAANQFGTTTITVTVTDASGGTATDTFVLTVNSINDEPTISQIDDVVMNEDGDITVNFTVGDLETAAGSLNVTGSSSNTTLFPSVGTSSSSRLRLGGTGANRTLRIRPSTQLSGESDVTLTVTDANGGTAQITFQITVNAVNDAPFADDDVVFAHVGAATPLPNLLSNDTDIDSASFSLISFDQPSSGTVTQGVDGVLTYTGQPGFRGFDSFTYTIQDSEGLASTAIVNLSVGVVDLVHTDLDVNYINGEWYSNINADYEPSAHVDSDEVVLFANPATKISLPALPPSYAFMGAGEGDDVWLLPQVQELDKLWLGFSNEDTNPALLGSHIQLDLVSFSGPGYFSLFDTDSFGEPRVYIDTFDGINSGDDAALGGNSAEFYTLFIHGHSHLNWSFTAAGRYTITLQPTALINTTDADGNPIQVTSTGPAATFYIDVDALTDIPLIENPPLARDDAATVSEDSGTTTINVLANDSSAPDPEEALTITGVTQGTSGVVAVAADGLSVTYTPAANFFGSDTFTYTITDEHGGVATATVTVTVSPMNDAPTAGSDSFTVTPGNAVRGNLLFNDADPEGDALTVLLASGPTKGTVELNGDGTFTYTPGAAFNGTDSFTYRASDGALFSSVTTVVINLPGDQQFAAVVSTGHTDIGVGYEEGWDLHVHDEENDVEYEPYEALLHVGAAAITTRSGGLAGPEYDFLGVAEGQKLYRLPQTENPELIYLGFGTEEIADGTFFDGLVQLRLKAVNGPGHFAAWQSTDEGPDVAMATADGITADDYAILLEGGHEHYNFSFTARGNYEVTFEAIATLADGTVTSSGDVTYRFVVNTAGVAEDDNYNVNEDTPLTVGGPGLLGNDVDPDGDTLVPTVVQGPANGTVTLNADGSFTYVPNANFSGTDTFTYTTTDVRYRIVPLGTLGGNNSFALDVNNNRQVSGNSSIVAGASNPLQAYLWQNGQFVPLGVLPGTGSNNFSRGYAVNDAGMVVGESDNNTSFAFVYDNGVMVGLTRLAGDNFRGVSNDINSDGDIVGSSSNGTTTRPTIWTFNGTTYVAADLGTIAGTSTATGRAWAINDAGEIVGLSTNADGTSQATLWSGGTITNLTSLGDGERFSQANGINGLGVVVGSSSTGQTVGQLIGTTSSTGITRAFIWEHGTIQELLPYNFYAPGNTGSTTNYHSVAMDINDAGIVVGNSQRISGSAEGATIWIDGAVYNLNTLVTGGSGWTLRSAEGINQAGDIVGFGSFGGFSRGYLLVPEVTSLDGRLVSNTATVTITVNPTADAPEATNDTYEVSAGSAVYGNVLFNDSDPDGDNVSIISSTTAAKGTVVLQTNGAFVYTPGAEFDGTDSFTYTISDGLGGTDTATVTISLATLPEFDAVLSEGHADIGIFAGSEDTVIDHGDHTHVVEGEFGWDLHVHDHEGDEEYAPDEALLFVGSQSAAVRPAGSQFDFIGVAAGETYYHLPQNLNPELLYLGVGTEEIADGTFLGGTVTLRLKNLNGPGHFSMWQSTDEGPAVAISTADGVTEGDFLTALEGGHTHFNYGFTATGYYAVTFEAFGTLPNGEVVSSGDVTYYFAVNTPPLASADQYGVGRSGVLTGNVLDNDTDADDQTLSVTLVTGPTNGVLDLQSDGSFTYTPGAGFIGDTFTYSVNDGFGGTHTATVTISQLNEGPTDLTLTPVVSTLPENTSTSSRIKVAEISFLDDGLGDNVLSLSGDDADDFELDGTSLYLKAGTTLNFETRSSYSVTVSADDSSVGSTPDATATYMLTVTNVNEAPSLSLQNAVTSLPESTSTTSSVKLGDLVITDDALGTNNLSLTGPDAAFFEIVGTELRLKAGTALNFESKGTYQVTVHVDDAAVGLTPDSSVAFTLTVTDVNEVPSLALQNAVTSLPENTNTTSSVKLADLVVTDDALGTNSLSLSGPDAAFFEIVGTELRLKAGAALNFEAKGTYQVTVNVNDATVGLTPDSSVAFTLTVSDVNEVPSLSLQNAVTSLPESTSTASSVKLADLMITDDALGTNNLSLTGPDAAFFEIVGTELRLKAGTTLNFESKGTYQVTVNVNDATVGLTPDSSVAFTLTVTDVNEAPSLALQNAVTSLPENTSTTSSVKVGDLVITDDAVGANILSLTGPDAAFFEIVGTELRLKAGTALNFEAKGTYQVTVNVNDATVGLTPDSSVAFTLTVTDVNEVPSLALQNTVTSLPENTNTTSSVKLADLVVTDDALGANTLSLSGPDAAFFEIVGTELRLKAGTVLNLESKGTYQVTVNVNDATVGLTPDSSVAFTLTVTEVNEAPSLSLQNAVTSLPESTSTTSSVKVGDLVITDDAVGTNTLSLTGPDAAFFEIVGTELRLKAGTTLDFESKGTYQVTVHVDDAAVGLTPDGSVAFTLTVTDVNEAPSLALQNTVTSLPENTNTTSSVKVGDLVITDDELGMNTLSLSGPDAAFFGIVGTELRLKAGTVLNFESKGTYQVTVHVDDAAVGLTPDSSVAFTLTVTDVNEAPSLAQQNAVTSLPENTNTTSSVKLADLVVTDDASGTNTLSLTGPDAAFFEVVGTELRLKAGTALNFEAKGTYQVSVNVNDATVGVTPDSSVAFTLTVSDLNEVPSLSLQNAVTSQPESTSTASSVKLADLVITDDALGTNNLSLTGPDAAFFEIVGTVLRLKAGTTLDFETKDTYQVTIRLDDDSVGGAVDASVAFTLTVEDAVDAPRVGTSQGATVLTRGSRVIVDPQISLQDQDSEDYGTGKVQVSIIAGARSRDRLRLVTNGRGADRMRVKRTGEVLVGKTVIGTLTANSPTSLEVTFAAGTTRDQVQRVLRNVGLQAQRREAGIRTLQFVAIDPNGTSSAPATKDVQVGQSS